MGCDIHLVIESPVDEHHRTPGVPQEWKFVHDFPYLNAEMFANLNPVEDSYSAWFTAKMRNYEFFAALAGVRGDGPAPNGLPADLAPQTQLLVDDWGTDGHSHTHYTGAEFAAIWGSLEDSKAAYTAARLRDEVDPEGPAPYETAAGYTDAYHVWCGRKLLGSDIDCRVIIWFDN